MSLHFIDLSDLVMDLKALDNRLTLTEGDIPQFRKALALLRKHIELAEERKRKRELTNDFLQMVSALREKDRDKAWAIFLKDKR